MAPFLGRCPILACPWCGMNMRQCMVWNGAAMFRDALKL